jgi:hypothetical protein
MRLRKAGIMALAACLMAMTAGSQASAQRSAVRDRPPGRNSHSGRIQRPAVSPYLNLFRRDAGPVPNYQTLVRPQLQQQTTNYNQSRALERIQQNVNEEIQRVERSAIAPTGHGAFFRFYSHFYRKQQ